jgi:ribonuclease P protein component
MLASQYRLKKKSSFYEVEEEGTVFQSESFGLAYLDKKDANNSLFGFVVSTKISKESVTRNKIKRSLHEAVRMNYSYIKPGYFVVFLAKQAAARKSTSNIMAEVKVALEKAGLFK